MNLRIVWLVLVGVFAYLLFYEWSEESKIKSELVASSRVVIQDSDELNSPTVRINNQNIQLYHKKLSPIVTEKSTNLSEQNKIVFKVPSKANKKNIKNSIEKIFKVNVTKVNIINKQNRTKLTRGRKVKVSGFKKAIITLKKGQSIDLTTGI